MVRQRYRNHPENCTDANDSKAADLELCRIGAQKSDCREIDYRDFGGTVSKSVAEILNGIPVVDRCSEKILSSPGEEETPQCRKDLESNDEKPREIKMQAEGPVQKIKTAESVRETVNQDGAVLLDIKQGLCFSMNPVGSKIWEMLKTEHSLEQIASALEVEFQVPRLQIDADITAFVSELRKRNLIVEDVLVKREDKRTWLSRVVNLRKPARS